MKAAPTNYNSTELPFVDSHKFPNFKQLSGEPRSTHGFELSFFEIKAPDGRDLGLMAYAAFISDVNYVSTLHFDSPKDMLENHPNLESLLREIASDPHWAVNNDESGDYYIESLFNNCGLYDLSSYSLQPPNVTVSGDDED